MCSMCGLAQGHLRIHALRITPCASRPHKLARPFLEVSVNRNDFGGRRLQFRTPCRRIHGESLRANGHDQPVSCGEKWIVFFRTQQYWSLLHVTHLTSSGEHLSWRHPDRVVRTTRLAMFLVLVYVRSGNNLRSDRGPSRAFPWRKRPINATPEDREWQPVAWFRR